MRPKQSDDTAPLSEGYVAYQRGDAWHVRFSIKGQGQFRFSLGTKDKDEAEILAQQKWRETILLAKHGIQINTKTFGTVAEEFIQQLEREVARGTRAEYQAKLYPPVIRKYFVGKFGNRQFDSIKPKDIEDYWEWRRDYWATGPGATYPYIRYERTIKGRKTNIRRPVKEGFPSDSTLSKEVLLLNQIFAFGVRHGYAKLAPEVAFAKSKKRTIKSRPGFTLDEFQKLLTLSEKRVNEDHINAHIRNDRSKLHAFCTIAGFTGMRPTEMFNLNWGDIERRTVKVTENVPQDVLILHARGKGKEREIATMPEILTPINLLWNIFILEVEREPQTDDPVFFNADGSRLRTFKKGLIALLEAADLRTAADGRKRDSFSFRHFYLTQQIREGVHHHVLAQNAGTSTKMIDAFYSKIRPTEEIAKLTPDWLGRRLPLARK